MCGLPDGRWLCCVRVGRAGCCGLFDKIIKTGIDILFVNE